MKTKLFKLVLLVFLQVLTPQVFSQNSPLNFRAIPSDDAYQIVLTWTDNSDSENGFVIRKEWDDYYWNSEEIIIPPNTTSYIDTQVNPNVPYYYSVDGVTTAVTLFRQPPPVPANVTATTGTSNNMSIVVNFTDNSDMETWYEVQHTSYLPEFSGDPRNFYGKEIITGVPLGSMITISNLKARGPYDDGFYEPNSTVYVRIRAVIKDGNKFIYSDFSPMVSAVTQGEVENPTNFIATAGVDNKIHLSWTDNSDHEAAFLLVRRTSTGEFTEGMNIISLPVNTTTFIDADVSANVKYVYRLVAIDMAKFTTNRPESVWLYYVLDPLHSVEASGMILKLPPAPSIDAVGISSTSILVNIGNTTFQSWIDLQIANSIDGPYSSVPMYDGASLSTEIGDLLPNSTYYFRVCGVLELTNDIYYGPFSRSTSASTFADTTHALVAPVAKPANFVTPTQFIANWTAVDGADYYELDVISINDSSFLSGYESMMVTSTSQIVTGTKANKRYMYEVRALNQYSESTNSNSIRVASSKGLILRTVCSDNPTSFRRWKVINNNPFTVELKWRVPNTVQTGELSAAPGETFFTTQTLPGINYVRITWYDDNLHQTSSLKSSTWKSCAETMVRSIDASDNIEDVSLYMVRAYPNPFVDKFKFMISTPDDSDVDVEIINMQGQRVLHTKVGKNTPYDVDGFAYPAGLYVIRARHMHTIKSIKITKK